MQFKATRSLIPLATTKNKKLWKIVFINDEKTIKKIWNEKDSKDCLCENGIRYKSYGNTS